MSAWQLYENFDLSIAVRLCLVLPVQQLSAHLNMGSAPLYDEADLIKSSIPLQVSVCALHPTSGSSGCC